MVPYDYPNFQFDVLQRDGIKHHGANDLSQLPTDGEDKTDLKDEVPLFTIMLANIVKEEEN